MHLLQLTALVPPEIAAGLSNGTLTRWGTVIRRAAGQPGGGQVVKHLKEFIPRNLLKSGAQVLGQPPMLPAEAAQLLQLSQVAAAASVLNLGVSVVGFAVMNHKLNRLQASVDAVSVALGDFREDAIERLERIEHRLVEIEYLQCLGLSKLHEVLAVLRDLRHDLFADKASVVGSRLREMGEPALTVDLRDVRRDLERVRIWLEQTITVPGSADPAWADVLMRYRLWVIASVAEVAALRRLGAAADAAALATSMASVSRTWTRGWAASLLPESEFGGVFLVQSAPLRERISIEVAPRLARLQLGEDLPRPDLFRRLDDSALLVAAARRRLPDGFAERAALAARTLDFVAETSERVESFAVEMDQCRQRRIGFGDWEGRTGSGQSPELQFLEMPA